MKSTVHLLVLAFFILFSNVNAAQEDSADNRSPKVKPFRIGAKIGFPNLIGGNVEYVTPLLKQRLSVGLDYSSISDKSIDQWIELENEAFKVTYFEAGLNYYFFKPGRGLYGGVSYGVFDAEFIFTGVESEEDTGQSSGTADTGISHSTMNVKLGAKWGGTIYFRPEVGYSFSRLPEEVDVNVRFPDGSTESQSQELPISEINKGLIFNLGLGLAF